MTITLTFALPSSVTSVRARPSDTHNPYAFAVPQVYPLTEGSGEGVIPAASTAAWRWVFEECDSAGDINATKVAAVTETANYAELSFLDKPTWAGPDADPLPWAADVAAAVEAARTWAVAEGTDDPGEAGAADALPATPEVYLNVTHDGDTLLVPAYLPSVP